MLLSLAALAAEAQMPDKFTNLQYFPKTISRQELMGNMRGFSFSLGVRCQFCHAGKDGNKREQMDFASDEKDTKKTARAMLRMVDAINQEYIAKMGRTAPIRVECVTCHHQLSIPKTMNALLAETIDKKDIQAALALYRDLRKNGLGNGQYDFGETSLNILTESLLKQDKAKEAWPSWSSTSKSTLRPRVGRTTFWQCPTWQTSKWRKPGRITRRFSN